MDNAEYECIQHETVRLSREAQDRKCAKLDLQGLKNELQSLKDLLAKVNAVYEDRRETIESISARIDVTRWRIAELLDDEQNQGRNNPNNVTVSSDRFMVTGYVKNENE